LGLERVEDFAHEWLTSGINIGAMKGMARYDFYVVWEMLLKRCNLWSFARSLATNDGTLLGSYRTFVSRSLLSAAAFHTWSILRSNFVNRSSFHIVDDIVTGSGDEMSIWEYLDSFLWTPQHMVQN
jgi:hypothetical protein